MRIQRLVPALFLLAAPAHAFPILDDFETGSFQLQASPGSPGLAAVPVSWPAHAITFLRDVTLVSHGPDAAGAGLDAFFLPDDEIQMVMPSGGGQLELRYAPPTAVDLTDGGQSDRITATFTVAETGTLSVRLTDISGDGAIANTVVAGPGAVFLPLSSFGSTDLQQIQLIEVFVLMSGGDFHLSDLRAASGPAAALQFAAGTTSVITPPYPSAPLTFDLALPAAELIQWSVPDAHAPPNPCAPPSPCLENPLHFLGSVSGGGASGPSAVAQFFWNDPGTGYPDSFFDIFLEFLPGPGGASFPVLPTLPLLTSTATGFGITFDIFSEDGAHQIVGTSRRSIAFDVVPGQQLVFRNPAVQAAAPRTSGGAAAAFHITFNLIVSGPVDTALPLVEAVMTGDHQPVVPTSVIVGEHSEGARAFSARPSVTRQGTEFVLDRAARGAGWIRIFDVTGRQLRTLPVRAGATSVEWNGRAEGGDPVRNGVYFARYTEPGRQLDVRVVRIR